GDDDPAVGLHGDGPALVVAAEVEAEDAAAAEAGVGRAVGPEADDGQVAAARAGRAARRDDGAVGLDGQAGEDVVAAEVEDDPAAAAEGGVGRAVGVEADEGEVALAGRPGVAAGEEAAAGQDGQGQRLVVAAEVDQDGAAAERRVEGPGR